MKTKVALAALAMLAGALANTVCAQSPTRMVMLAGSTTPGEFEKRVIVGLSQRGFPPQHDTHVAIDSMQSYKSL
jgi:hypothetical protein